MGRSIGDLVEGAGGRQPLEGEPPHRDANPTEGQERVTEQQLVRVRHDPHEIVPYPTGDPRFGRGHAPVVEQQGLQVSVVDPLGVDRRHREPRPTRDVRPAVGAPSRADDRSLPATDTLYPST